MSEPSAEVMVEAFDRFEDVVQTGMIEFAHLFELPNVHEAVEALENMPAQKLRRILLADVKWRHEHDFGDEWMTGYPPDLPHWLD